MGTETGQLQCFWLPTRIRCGGEQLLPSQSGPSLGCGHVDDDKAFDVWEVGADEIHLQLPRATLGGGDAELDQGPLLGLQGGNAGGKRRGRQAVSVPPF